MSSALFLVLAFVAVRTSFACSCIQQNQTTVYCSQHFEGGADGQPVIEYNVEHKLIFRDSSQFNKTTNKDILVSWTYPNSCGLDLKAGNDSKNEYLVSGYVSEGELWIHLCSWWNAPWSQVGSDEQKKLKEGWYNSFC
uniref:NTR domain-containing protein n=1 Tax=Plectus sambesii TaxID=2011161 RepID=A0A914V5V1_9BILA